MSSLVGQRRRSIWKRPVLFLLSLLHTINAAPTPSPKAAPLDREMAKFDKLRVNSAESYAKLKRTHEDIYYGAVKALMGQVGKNHYKQIHEGERRLLARCLDRIESRFDLTSPAKCLLESKLRHMEWEEEEVQRIRDAKPAFVQEQPRSEEVQQQHKHTSRPRPIAVFGADRLAKLRAKMEHMAANKKNSVRRINIPALIAPKKKTDRFELYRARRRRMRRNADDGGGLAQLFASRKERAELVLGPRRTEMANEEEKEKFQIKSSDSMLPLGSRAEKTVPSRISNLLVKMMGQQGERGSERWTKVSGTLGRLAAEIEQRKKFPGTKVYEKRMYDIVLDREEASLSPKERRSHLGLLQEGVKLIDMMPGRNGSANTNSSSPHNFRLFSPRFMPLAPDKGGPVHPDSMMSPTLLAMYEEQDTRSVGNVPEMLRKAGIPERDRQKLIGALMDVSGTTSHVEKAMDMLKGVDFFNEGVGGPILKATERVLNAFFSLEDSLTPRQKTHCSQNGYTFARKEQIEKLLRDQALDPEQLPDLAHFDQYDGWSDEQRELALWGTIEQIAMGNRVDQPLDNVTSSLVSHRRVKRTFPPKIFQPIILSPFQFAPTFGLVVGGPAILSPSTFSPYILGPNVFSPLILAPPVFGPLVLSPSVASPWIVTPGVGNPYIISPYVFGPFILGPLVMHPFILSPYIISPNILNPYVLSPIVLNPIVLSPDILSPQVLGGAVLSPAMLSPAILTQTYLMVSIFSPTFLS